MEKRTESLSDLHAARALADEAHRTLDQQVIEAQAEIERWTERRNALAAKRDQAWRIRYEAENELAEAEAFFARPIDGTDEASAVRAAVALISGQVA